VHREDYEPAVALAKDVEEVLGGSAPGIVGTAERIANHLRKKRVVFPIQVALRESIHAKRPRREPEYILVPRGLVAAAEYFLSIVELPAVHGVRRMVAHDRYTCQNPRCRRRTLRLHPHHMQQRQHGGTDEPANIVSGCHACHLRGIHSGQMSVVRIEDWLVWTWPDGGVVLMHSPLSELVYERRPARDRDASNTIAAAPISATNAR
jgi:hypothetical protein